MKLTTLMRRSLLRTALATTALAAPFVAYAAGHDAPGSDRVLAWHSNIAPRWLDPQKHYGLTAPDNSFRDDLYDDLALTERLKLG